MNEEKIKLSGIEKITLLVLFVLIYINIVKPLLIFVFNLKDFIK